MKQIVLMAAFAASVAYSPTRAIAAAEQDADRIAPIPLWQICLVPEPPAEGAIYENDMNLLMVRQVVPGGVLAGIRTEALFFAPTRDLIFVGTTHQYADGDVLRSGFYRSVGKWSYTTVIGARKTVYAFKEIPAEEQRVIAAVRQNRRAAEEARSKEEQRQAEPKLNMGVRQNRRAAEEARRKEEQRQAGFKSDMEVQKERLRHAADALSAFDFNFSRRVVIQRSIRKNVMVEIIDPEWFKFAALQDKQDWLGLLGAVDGNEYDEFPSEKEMDVIFSLLRERTFRISVKSMRPPIRVSVFAWRMRGNRCVLGGGDRWGQLRVFGADSGHVALKGVPMEKAKENIKGEELMVAPFAKKVYVINGDTVRKTYSELGLENGFGSGVDEYADGIEEWLNLN